MSSPDPRAHDRSDPDYGMKPNRKSNFPHIKKPMKFKPGLGNKLIAFSKALKKKMN